MRLKRFLALVFAVGAFAPMTLPIKAQPSRPVQIPVTIADHAPDVPVVFGVPIPEGQLHSPDHVRVLDARGREIPSQITKVSTWEPADPSIKWIWVFFFTGNGERYTVEYGEGVVNARDYPAELTVRNNQRPTGEATITTGPLRLVVRKGEGGGWGNAPAGSGFFDTVELDLDGDGFEEGELIARGEPGRGSFLDLVNGNGPDSSRAVVTRTVKELGSGPLHAIVRVEGEYRYADPEHPAAPFVTRVHAFAGKSYVSVDHTVVYTGTPDQSPRPADGEEYEAIATQGERIIDEQALRGHPGWTVPWDQVQAAGVRIRPMLEGTRTVRTSLGGDRWWDSETRRPVEALIGEGEGAQLFQTGPNPSQIPPLANSGPDSRLEEGFRAGFTAGEERQEAARAPGWISVHDRTRGLGVAFREFFEEYPKEIALDAGDGALEAFIWSPTAGPLSLARADGNPDSGMIANFAAGMAKTTAMVFHFHASEQAKEAERVLTTLSRPPVPVVDPQWMTSSGVFGKIATPDASETAAPYERGLAYKFDWMRFNQQWEPWYGLLNYGDFKTYYYGNDWVMWTNNEPANDYMWWLQFARTGDPDLQRMARATSRHTMDIDNIHWPLDPVYVGDTNESLHWFQTQARPAGSPYAGMGRRHANQHFTSLLSAHVWTAGWTHAYLMGADHRALDAARLTGDYYIRRPFGDHGLRGRRLYLSIWNLAELYDVTKEERYGRELQDRLRLMRDLQYHPDQGGSIVIDRYGYSQIYVANGLRKVHQMTREPWIAASIVDNARRLRDLPPLNHDMESYLSSISSLLLGYEFSGEQSLLDEAVHRARYLRTGEIDPDRFPFASQREYADALEAVSELPKTPGSRRPPIWQIANGLRIFGWTSIYQVPWLGYWMQQQDAGGR